jgi:small subunit ribosomal protein S21
VVEVYDGNIEGALKRFKKESMKVSLFKEIKRHDFYTKPGERKRLKSKLARAKINKSARRQEAARVARLLQMGMTDDG